LELRQEFARRRNIFLNGSDVPLSPKSRARHEPPPPVVVNKAKNAALQEDAFVQGCQMADEKEGGGGN